MAGMNSSAQPCDEPLRAAPRPAHHAPMLTRRKFAQAAAAAGAVLAFGKGSAAAPAWRERRDLYPQGVASGDPAPDSVLLWTRRQPAGGDPRAAYLLTVEVAKDPDVPRRRRARQSRGHRRHRLDLPLHGGRAQARDRILVPLHRRRRQRQPRRPHAHCAEGERLAPGPLHVRELPGHDDRRRERLSPHDLRGRAPPARRAARLRAAPRRLHLRSGELRGRDAGGQVPRPPPAPAVQVPRRRQVPRLPPARDARGLPHGVPRLSHRPRPAGRARPLAVRSGVGQPRVLVAGIPGHPGVRRRAAPRADEEGRGQPGVVGIPAGARRAARREHATASRRPRSRTRRSRSSTRTASASAPTTRRPSRA